MADGHKKSGGVQQFIVPNWPVENFEFVGSGGGAGGSRSGPDAGGGAPANAGPADDFDQAPFGDDDIPF